MDKSTLWFVYMSLFYLAVGAVLGLVMIFHPAAMAVIFRVHAHINLLGWVSMMIFGVTYHVMPRFSGRPMRYPRLIWPHFWLTNVGLIGMAITWTLGARGGKELGAPCRGLWRGRGCWSRPLHCQYVDHHPDGLSSRCPPPASTSLNDALTHGL